MSISDDATLLSSSAAAAAPPPAPPGDATLNALRSRLAHDLRALWDWEASHLPLSDGDYGPLRRNAKTVRRTSINLFLSQVSHQLKLEDDATCIDWGSQHRHMFQCSTWYEYAFSDRKNSFERATPTRSGRVVGSIHNLSHAPEQLLSFAMVTEVFEHIPYFWQGMPQLYRLMKPGGIIVLTAPFAYPFHPMPGDYWRYSPTGLWHAAESVGLRVCAMVTDGVRAVQALSLGFAMEDLGAKYFQQTQSKASLLRWNTGSMFVMQRPHDDPAPGGAAPGQHGEGGTHRDGVCSMHLRNRNATRLNLTNEVPKALLQKFHRQAWLAPNREAYVPAVSRSR